VGYVITTITATAMKTVNAVFFLLSPMSYISRSSSSLRAQDLALSK